MSEIALFPFQTRASATICERFQELCADELRPAVHKRWAVPYYQALSALPGSGKTPILADAVAQIRATLDIEPIVLWISKAKAVVEQTRANFEPGGKYAHLVDGFVVSSLADLKEALVTDASTPYLILATVGAFNQRDKGDGTLRVHKPAQDSASGPPWTVLHHRTVGNRRRPLLVVYDEGHNLTDQQTDLLMELEPDAFLVASATMKTPARLSTMIDRLKEHGWSEDRLITAVPSKAVVEAGLVKRQLVLGGYTTVVESTLSDLLQAFGETTRKAAAHNAPFRPKAIYVCRTNISQDDGTPDNTARPFNERRAPPILIWRHLVQSGVSPADIAVYCDLKFDRRTSPPPDDFVLFSGGDDDFAAFTEGNFTHVIFNLGLQEGWDDPACSFVYIDKSMGSTIQVEQVIGRALRQPGAQHYSDPDLNTASFFIRVDDKHLFPQILETVRKKIAADVPEVRLNSYVDRRDRVRVHREAKAVRTAPEIHIDSEAAVLVLNETIANLPDYRADAVNTTGKGQLVRALQRIGDGSLAEIQQIEMPHSNRVMTRWIVRRAIQGLYPEVVKTIDWSNPKFDAAVEIRSPAAILLREAAEKLVDQYLEHSTLEFEPENVYTVGPVIVDPKKFVEFKNGLHDGYSDLSDTEREYADAIDATGVVWARNPVNGGFSVPLLEKGDRRKFFPDFLVWKGDAILALDPKGGHLIGRDSGTKLLEMRSERGRVRLIVRLFTEGKWQDERTKIGPSGITLWGLRAGRVKPRHFESISAAVQAALAL